MKKIFNYFAILIATLSIFSCVKIDNSDRVGRITNSNGEYAILFSDSPATKATNVNGVATYNEFALYTWNSNNEVIMNPFTVNKAENGYVYDGVNSQTLQYFKNNADSYNFIGVIPTTGFTFNENKVTGNVKSFTVDDNRASGTITADSPDEFLYAYKSVVKDDYNKNVTLPFKHGNALLYLGFISDDAATEILDYTPHVDYQPAQPAVPGTTTTTTKTGKALDMLYAGEIVYWPYAGDSNLTSTQANNFYKNTSNYGNMGNLMDAVNAQFVYYNTSGTVTTNAWAEGNKKDMFGIQLATTTNKDDFVGGTTEDTWKDAFWTNASTQIKDVFRTSYAAGWRVIRIEHIAGTQYDAWLLNNTENTYKVITTTGGSPAVPEVPESGYKGIRIFSASIQSEHYVHVAHTNTADATVSTTLAFSNRATSTDVIPFSLPTATTVPVGTTEADAVYSPTTFYAIPGDAGLTHFVVKLSYTYKGTTVYDVRVPIILPTAGLEPGKYYKYIINITSTGNGTNDPNEADPDADEIDIVNNPIVVTVDVTDYINGHTQIITI